MHAVEGAREPHVLLDYIPSIPIIPILALTLPLTIYRDGRVLLHGGRGLRRLLRRGLLLRGGRVRRLGRHRSGALARRPGSQPRCEPNEEATIST